MQKRIFGMLIGIALLMTLCMNVLAVYTDGSLGESTTEKLAPPDIRPAQTESSNINTTLLDNALKALKLDATTSASDTTTPAPPASDLLTSSDPQFLVNGQVIADADPIIIGDSTYVSIRSLVTALYPDATVAWENDQLVASGKGFHLSARPGDLYIVVNDRYLYVPDAVLSSNDVTYAPLRTVANAIGGTTQWDMVTQDISVTGGGATIASGSSYYNSDDLHWMSRIIAAESRNQPLKGKIGVGTVIMNRVESPQFPNSIHAVIFSGNQFSPVQNGSIHKQPNVESIIAAKLVLDGARETGDSLFFNQTGLDCWASRNRPFVTTIAGHSFYL